MPNPYNYSLGVNLNTSPRRYPLNDLDLMNQTQQALNLTINPADYTIGQNIAVNNPTTGIANAGLQSTGIAPDTAIGTVAGADPTMPMISLGVGISDTMNDLIYSMQDPMHKDYIFDVAQRGTKEDGHVLNSFADLVFTGNGLWGESSAERELKEGINHARDIAYDLGNTFNSANSVESILNINANAKMPELLTAKSPMSDNGRSMAAAEEINPILRQGYRDFVVGRNNQLKNIAQGNQRRQLMNYFDNGGSLDELNGVTHFNVGGSHSENPYEGIQQGIASDGNPNLVEEGEVKYNDYIYSARLKPSKTLLKDYLLPDNYAGLTFAEVAEKLQKESEDRPNDAISKTTLDEWMSRLAGAQEEYKAKAEQRKLAKLVNNMTDEEKAMLASSLVQPMTQQQGIDLGQPMYAEGGKIHIAPSKRGTFTAAAKKHGKSVQAFASQVLANKENYSPAMVKKANFARNAKKFKHADGGHLFDYGGYPWRIGFVYDMLNQQPLPVDETSIPNFYNNVSELEALADKYTITAKANKEPLEHMPAMVKQETVPEFAELSYDQSGLDAAIEAAAKKESNSFNFNLEDLRYAPAIGAGIGALTAALQPKDFTVGNEYRQLASNYNPIGAPHIGGYRRYTPYDVNLGDVENLALLASTIDSNRGQNRATQGALNAAVINAAQKTAAARNLAAQQANEANRLAVDTYNLGIDQFNANRDTQYDQLNQQILANKLNMLASAAQADDASKQAWAEMYNSTHENFFNQLGNVGRDTWSKNQRDWLLNALGREGLLELVKSGYKLG